MATRVASSALPRGLRIRRRRFPVWLGAVALALAGLGLGGVLTQAPTVQLFGALVVIVAAAIAFSRPSASLALLAFTYPFDLRTYAGPVKLTTSAALMAIIVATLVARWKLLDRSAWRSTPLDVPVLAFAGATLLSISGLGGHWDTQAVGLIKAAGGFLIFFIATQTLRSKEDVWLVVGATLASGLIQAAMTALPVVNGTSVLSMTSRAEGTLFAANLFAGYLILIIPLALAIGLAFRSRWTMLPTLLVALLFIVALVATLSRSGWLGLLGSTVLLVVLWPQRRQRVVALAAGVGVLLLAAGLFAPIGSRLGPGDWSPLAELANRWGVWTVAVQITMHHPLGVGVENFSHYFLPYTGGTISHAHNLFLNIAAERGIIGLIAFAALLFNLFRTLDRSIKKVDTRFERALAVGLTASLGGYVVHSIFDATYYDYKVLLLFWLLLGVAATLPSGFASPRGAEATISAA